MIYDDLDFFIIEEFYKAALNKEETTTWKITKKFNWKDKPQYSTNLILDEFYTNKMALIRSRIKNMAEEGFVKIEKKDRGNNVFTLLGDRVLVCKHKFQNGYKDSLHIKGKDEKWAIFEL